MKTYRVLRSNYGYLGRYWREGDFIKLEDNEEPPSHFELVSEEVEKEAKAKSKTDKDEVMTLSELGMRKPEKQVTAGEYAKKQAKRK